MALENKKMLDSEILQEAIGTAIKQKIESEWQDIRKSAIEDFDNRKAEIISSVVLQMMQTVEMQQRGSTLTIRVNFEK
jgi:predicted nucleic-acid-binding protein